VHLKAGEIQLPQQMETHLTVVARILSKLEHLSKTKLIFSQQNQTINVKESSNSNRV
jgi:hypothetical protein